MKTVLREFLPGLFDIDFVTNKGEVLHTARLVSEEKVKSTVVHFKQKLREGAPKVAPQDTGRRARR